MFGIVESSCLVVGICDPVVVVVVMEVLSNGDALTIFGLGLGRTLGFLSGAEVSSLTGLSTPLDEVSA